MWQGRSLVGIGLGPARELDIGTFLYISMGYIYKNRNFIEKHSKWLNKQEKMALKYFSS